MKNFIFTTVIAALLLGGLNSCNKNEAEFGIPYVIAYALNDGQAYKPVIYFPVINGNLSKGSVSKDGMPMSGRKIEGYNIYEVYADYANEYSLESLNGSYTAYAESTEEEVSQIPFTFNFTEDNIIGELHFDDFKYSSGNISFTVTEQVENATSYGVYYRIVGSGAGSDSYSLSTDFNVNTPAQTSGNQKINFSLNSYDIGTDVYLQVWPAAASSTTGGSVIKLGTPKTLRPKGTSFEEDKTVAE